MGTTSGPWPQRPTQSVRWRRWVTVWTVLSAPSVLIATDMWGLGVTAQLALGAAVLAGSAHLIVATRRDASGQSPRRNGFDRDRSAPLTADRIRGAAGSALLGATVVVAAGVCGLLSDVAAVAYLLLAGSTSPIARDIGRLESPRRDQVNRQRDVADAVAIFAAPCARPSTGAHVSVLTAVRRTPIFAGTGGGAPRGCSPLRRRPTSRRAVIRQRCKHPSEGRP